MPPVALISQRQHLSNPDSYAAEVVAAGQNVSICVALNGITQELRIRLGRPTPFLLDNKATVFVASNDAAVKKSVWLVRRVQVITEAVTMKEIAPIHISERDMVADPFTKYLVYAVWFRHMGYLLNRPRVDG